MLDDEETAEDAEVKRWHGEEIHRRDGLAVIAQEDHPAFLLVQDSSEPFASTEEPFAQKYRIQASSVHREYAERPM